MSSHWKIDWLTRESHILAFYFAVLISAQLRASPGSRLQPELCESLLEHNLCVNRGLSLSQRQATGRRGIVLTNKGFKVCFDICNSGLNVWTLDPVVPSPLFGLCLLLYKLSLKYTEMSSLFLDWIASLCTYVMTGQLEQHRLGKKRNHGLRLRGHRLIRVQLDDLVCRWVLYDP